MSMRNWIASFSGDGSKMPERAWIDWKVEMTRLQHCRVSVRADYIDIRNQNDWMCTAISSTGTKKCR
jgi:hypothetical protein